MHLSTKLGRALAVTTIALAATGLTTASAAAAPAVSSATSSAVAADCQYGNARTEGYALCYSNPGSTQFRAVGQMFVGSACTGGVAYGPWVRFGQRSTVYAPANRKICRVYAGFR